MKNILWVAFMVIVLFVVYSFWSGAMDFSVSINMSYNSMHDQIAAISDISSVVK